MDDTCIASDGTGSSDPPSEHEAPVERHEGGDDPEDGHGDGASPDGCLPSKPVGDQARAEGTKGKACIGDVCSF